MNTVAQQYEIVINHTLALGPPQFIEELKKKIRVYEEENLAGISKETDKACHEEEERSKFQCKI